MQIILRNKTGTSSRVKVENKNNIGKVVFNKVGARGNTTFLTQLADVNISLQQDGDVLVYNAATNTYFIKTLPSIDGGTF